MYCKGFTVFEDTKIIDALKIIDLNQQGFVIVVDEGYFFKGVLTDGDVRRGIINGCEINESVKNIYTYDAINVHISDGMESVVELFKDQEINFLPIVDEEERLVNIITKKQIHALLMQDIHADLRYDFFSIDTSIVDHEIYLRPWGYFKTTVLNDFYQAKIISIKPGGCLSLQSRNHREEYWIVVHGKGEVQLDKSKVQVKCGNTVFIPIGCKHRVLNTDQNEYLIINEVQIGEYFGEDDIIRYEDIYKRV